MKTKNKVLLASLCACLSLFSQSNAAVDTKSEGYAESLYSDFTSASNNAVIFSLRLGAQGSVAKLKGAPLMRFVGTPSYMLISQDKAIEIASVTLKPVSSLNDMDLEELNADVSGFDEAGFPVNEGRYRQFSVDLTINNQKYSHQAIEFCWEKQEHCVVFDPSIMFLDSIVNGIRQQKASGYAVNYKTEAADILAPSAPSAALAPTAKSGRCGLASNHAQKQTSIEYDPYSRSYYGLLFKKAQINVAYVKVGLACDANCKIQPFAQVDTSDGWSRGIHSVQCDRTSDFAKSGGTGRYVAASGCSHSYSIDAHLDLSVENAGSLQSKIKVSAIGGVESNGGIKTDTCGFF